MAGNDYQYDPTEMFKDWLQKGGKAQADFMKAFGSMMPVQKKQDFDPMEIMREMGEKTSQAQTNFMENLQAMQNKSMDGMFNIGQMMPKMLSWGAFKTTVGSNGRISIPEAERDAIGIKEGDLVQVVILPIVKKSKKEVKK